jgi:hypothetical protein
MKHRCAERIKRLLAHPYNRCCDICPWIEFQTINFIIDDVVVGSFPICGQPSTDLRRLTMVNRQILVFEVAIGRKSMIRSTAKIPPILVCERSFLRVVSAIDVMIEEKRSLRGQPRQPRQDLN